MRHANYYEQIDHHADLGLADDGDTVGGDVE